MVSPFVSMPVHRYVPVKCPCKLCGEGFDHRHDVSDAALINCPTCGQAVTRAPVQAVHTPKLLAPISVSKAKQSGFTVMKRISDTEFERQ
jgi:predicted nucleic acid-binding Zn ribbon protein